MNLFLQRVDWLVVLFAADSLTLPDPKAFASIGWTLVSLCGVVKGADLLLNFYKRHIKQSIPSGDWVTTREMDDLKKEVHNQLTENRTYVHDAVHDVNTKLDGIRQSGDSGREGLHNRLGTIIEVVAELRGENKGMVIALKTSAEAAQMAALSAAKAADRADEAARRNH